MAGLGAGRDLDHQPLCDVYPDVLAWEPDEISIINLYAMYIPMFAAIMFRCKEFGFFKRFVLPALGIVCCLFMCYCCWVGKGYKQIFGYLIFLAVVLLVGALFKNSVTRENNK